MIDFITEAEGRWKCDHMYLLTCPPCIYNALGMNCALSPSHVTVKGTLKILVALFFLQISGRPGDIYVRHTVTRPPAV